MARYIGIGSPKSADQQCANFDTVSLMNRLEWRLQHLDGVQSTKSLGAISKRILAGMNEGSLKWMALNRNQSMMDAASLRIQDMREGLLNDSCNLAPMLVYPPLRFVRQRRSCG